VYGGFKSFTVGYLVLLVISVSDRSVIVVADPSVIEYASTPRLRGRREEGKRLR
jgi:hypothetical protein